MASIIRRMRGKNAFICASIREKKDPRVCFNRTKKDAYMFASIREKKGQMCASIGEKVAYIYPRSRRTGEEWVRNAQSERVANETLGTGSLRSECISLSVPYTFPRRFWNGRLRVKHV